MSFSSRLVDRAPFAALHQFTSERYPDAIDGNPLLALETGWVDDLDFELWCHATPEWSYLITPSAQAAFDFDVSSLPTADDDLLHSSLVSSGSTPTTGPTNDLDVFDNPLTQSSVSLFDILGSADTSEWCASSPFVESSVVTSTPASAADFDSFAAGWNEMSTDEPQPHQPPFSTNEFDVLVNGLSFPDDTLTPTKGQTSTDLGNLPSLFEDKDPSQVSTSAPSSDNAEMDGSEYCASDADVGDLEDGSDYQWTKSDTYWADDDVSSRECVSSTHFQITSATSVDCFERVIGLPSQFPVPRLPTAYQIDLSSSAYDALFQSGKSVDGILKDHDIHSWDSTTGPTTKVSATLSGELFGLDSTIKIPCRRALHRCHGCWACSMLSEDFRNVENYEIVPSKNNDDRVRALIQQRGMQDTTAIGRANAWWRSIKDWKCLAVNAAGVQCTGKPMLRSQKVSHGKDQFVDCSRRSKNWPDNHLHYFIPPFVDNNLLEKVLNGEVVEDTAPTMQSLSGDCAFIVSSRTGAALKHCPFNHVKDGVAHQATMEHLDCRARTHVYVPLKGRLPTAHQQKLERMAIVVPASNLPHTHPIPPSNKLTSNVITLYERCVHTFGIHRATVAKVENAASTLKILGRTPSLYHPGLVNNKIKVRIIERLRKVANGGASNPLHILITMYQESKRFQPNKRYLQHYEAVEGGHTLVITMQPFLASFIHEVQSIDADTTFKRVRGTLDEFEIGAYIKSLAQSVTICRVYTDKHDSEMFELAWDRLQDIILKVTGRRLGFKRLHHGGTLLGINADMEIAPLHGLARSLYKTMDIAELRQNLQKPEDILFYILRICYIHAERGVPTDIEADPDLQHRLNNYMYMRSIEDVDDLQYRVYNHGNKKLIDWWDHKIQVPFVLPGLIQSLSQMFIDDWHQLEASTNIGEGLHAWTNRNTGIQRPFIEAFKSAEQVDQQRAEELEQSVKTGLLRNPRNDLVHRYSRNNQRKLAASNCTTLMRKQDAHVAELREKRDAINEELKRARDEQKSNSSGRVPSRQMAGLPHALAVQGKTTVLPVTPSEPERTEDVYNGNSITMTDLQNFEEPEPASVMVSRNNDLSGKPVIAGVRRSTRARTSVVHGLPPASEVPSSLATSYDSRKRRRTGARWAMVEEVNGVAKTATDWEEWKEQNPEEYEALYGANKKNKKS